MAQSANGFQTGLSVFPSAVTIESSTERTIQFNAVAGVTGNVGITWSLGSGAKGTLSAAGLYTPPSPITAVSVDQVLATAVDGSQAEALVSLAP